MTRGIALLHEQMLNGTITHPWQLIALVGIAAILLTSSRTPLWRELRPG